MPIKGAAEATAEQQLVHAHFESAASEWEEMYQRQGVYEHIHQERLRRVLDLVASLGLPPHARALDAGCGAGFATLGLARMGFVVEAIDPVPAMLDATAARAERAGHQDRVRTGRGDLHALDFSDRSFDLVLAIGVLPWIAAPLRPLQEMSRVLRPGGHLVFTIDNRWALRNFIEPLSNPLLRPAKEAARLLLRRRPTARSHRMSLRHGKLLLAQSGLAPGGSQTLGFGPFSVFGRDLLPTSPGLRLHRRLQAYADRGAPVLRSGGTQFILMARKPPAD